MDSNTVDGHSSSMLLLSTLDSTDDQEISNTTAMSSVTLDGNKEVEEEKLKDQSWWELDTETGKYVENGPNPRRFKIKSRMRVKVRDDHLLLRHVEAGNGKIKCHVKMDNVREELGIKHGTLEQPIRVETHTPETHPLVCPFTCPNTNVPCEASFQMKDQNYFAEHVMNGKCPYSKGKKLEDILPPRILICQICNEEVCESSAQEHLDQVHFKVVCPVCKSRHEDRVSVEDHIINDHATHFISGLPSVYRKNNRIIFKPPELPKETETLEPVRSEYQTLEDLLREKAAQEAMIREQAKYLAGLKGLNQNNFNNFLERMPRPSLPPRPLMRAPVRPRPRASSVLSSVLLVPPLSNPKVRPRLNFTRPNILRSNPPRRAGPAGPAGPAVSQVNGGERLQQIRLKTGELMWAVATEMPSLVRGSTARVMFKIVGPVVAGAPPPVLVKTAPPVRAVRPTVSHIRLAAFKPAVKPTVLQPISLPPRQSLGFGAPQNYIKRVDISPPANGGGDHNYGGPNKMTSHQALQQLIEKEIEDEIQEIDPLDPLALDEGVDPLAGLDPFENDNEVSILT